MNYVEKLFDEVHYAFNLNAATLSGAIDILVIPQLDGTLKCTPFHVRFGKLQLIQSSAKVISIHVNGQKTDLQMKLGQAGEAFFVEESDEPVPPLLATSPIPSPKSNRKATPTTASTTTTSTTTTSSTSSTSSSTTTSPTNITHTTQTSSSSTTTHIHSTSSSTNASPIPSTTTKFTQKSNEPPFDPKEMKPLTSALEEMILNQTNSFSSGNNNNSNNNNANKKSTPSLLATSTPSILSRSNSRPSSPVTVDTQSPLGSYIIDCGESNNCFSPSGSPPKISNNNTTTTTTTAAAAITTTSSTEPVSDSESEPKFWRWGGFPKFSMRRNKQPTPTTTTAAVVTSTSTSTSTTTSPTSSRSLATSQDNIVDTSSTSSSTITTTSSTFITNNDTPIIINSNTDKNKNRLEEINDNDIINGGNGGNGGGEPVSPLVYSPTISSNGSDDGSLGLAILNNNNSNNHSIPIPTPNNTPINPSMLNEHHQSSLEGSSSWTRMGSLLKMFKKDHSGGNNLDTLSTNIPTTNTTHSNNNNHNNHNNNNNTTTPTFIIKDITDNNSGGDDNMFLLDEEQEQQEKQEKQQQQQQQQTDQIKPKSSLPTSPSYADIVKEGENLNIDPSTTPSLPAITSTSTPKLVNNDLLNGTTMISTSHYPIESSISECLSKLNYESEYPSLKSGATGNEIFSTHKDTINSTTTSTGGNSLIDHFSISLSLCGHLILDKALQYEPEEKEQFFQEYLITFEHFCSDVTLLKNPHLVAKINDQYYPWSVAGHIILSYLIYRRPITLEALNNLKRSASDNIQTITNNNNNNKNNNNNNNSNNNNNKPTATTPTQPTQPVKQSSYWRGWLWKNNSNVQNNNQTISPSSSPPSSTQSVLNKSDPIAFTNNNSNIVIEDAQKKFTKKSLRPSSDQLKSLGLKKGSNRITFVVSSTLLGQKEVSASIYLWDNSSKIVISDIDGTITKSDVFGQVLPLIGKDWSHIGVAELYSNIKENGYQIIYLTSRAIGQANLTRTYISSVKQTGSSQSNSSSIISSSTTTITNNVNSNNSSGINNNTTNLNNVSSNTTIGPNGNVVINNNNGIVLNNGATGNNINISGSVNSSGNSGNNGNVVQSIPFTLPEGPVFMSPNRLLTSFNREVIKRNPEEFKIACLQDIQNIFPNTMSPFYAGFGNRNTDAISYNAVGVPKGKTFTINALGVINTTNTTYNKTYTKLNDLVQDMFPCQNSNKHSVDEQWNEYHYWKKSVIPLHKLEPL